MGALVSPPLLCRLSTHAVMQTTSCPHHSINLTPCNNLPLCSQVLADIGNMDDVPIITAWNKIDACADPALVRSLAAQRPNTVCISGSSGEGLEELMELIAATLEKSMVEVQVSCWCVVHRYGMVMPGWSSSVAAGVV